MVEAKRAYPSREGKKSITIYVDTQDYRSLRIIAAQEDKSLHIVVVEAIKEFLSKR